MMETLGTTLPFFALILCGYVAGWSGLIKGGSAQVLNNFVLYFAGPALLIRTLAGVPSTLLVDADFLMAWAGVGATLFIVTAAAALVIFRFSGPDAVIGGLAGAFGNVGFLGIALVIGIIGEEAAAGVSMALAVDLAILVPVSLAVLELLEKRSGSPLAIVARAFKAFVANPFIVAIFLGFLLSFGGIGIAQVADDFLHILGSAAIPTALFAIGATLYGQPIGSAWIEIGVVSTIKLIVHPAAVFVITTQVFDLPPDLVAVATLSAALPMANNLFVIATRYNVRPPVASAAILISTIAAIGTFNVWAAIVLP